MPNDLKPCPFCGGKAILDRERVSGAPYYAYLVVRCVECNARFMGQPADGFIRRPDSRDFVAEAKELEEKWNRRINEVKCGRLVLISAETHWFIGEKATIIKEKCSNCGKLYTRTSNESQINYCCICGTKMGGKGG